MAGKSVYKEKAKKFLDAVFACEQQPDNPSGSLGSSVEDRALTEITDDLRDEGLLQMSSEKAYVLRDQMNAPAFLLHQLSDANFALLDFARACRDYLKQCGRSAKIFQIIE